MKSVATAQFHSVQVTAMTAGQVYGPYISSIAGDTFSRYEVVIEKIDTCTWPDEVMVPRVVPERDENGVTQMVERAFPLGALTVEIDYSQDGGATWREDAKATFGGGDWFDVERGTGKRTPTDTAGITVAMGVLEPHHPTNRRELTIAPADLFRVTVRCLQDCSVHIYMGGIK